MRAPVRHELGTPLAVQDVDDSPIATGQLVVAVKRRGMCGTDPLATIRLDVSQPYTRTVGFRDFLEAFQSLRTHSGQYKIILD
jgi:D-arabinose 1-dehydrogenase-like Zn-dependent alcohol dehydrogenase